MMRYFRLVLIICLMSFSCEEQFGIAENEPSQTVIDISLQLFHGDVTEKLTVMEDDVSVWKVKIENNEGAIVSFYWQKNYNIIFKIVGETGPFNYDLRPPLNVLPLSTAKFLAFESYSENQLSLWILKREAKDKRWIYQFFILGNESPYTIDATSGDVP